MRKKLLAMVLLVSCAIPTQNLFAAKESSIFCRRNRVIAESIIGVGSLATYLICRKKVKAAKAQLAALDEGVLLPGDIIVREELERALRKHRIIRNTALGILITSGVCLSLEAVGALMSGDSKKSDNGDDGDEGDDEEFEPTIVTYNIGDKTYVTVDGRDCIKKTTDKEWYSLKVFGKSKKEGLLFKIHKTTDETFEKARDRIELELNKKSEDVKPGDLNTLVGELKNICSTLSSDDYDIREITAGFGSADWDGE